MVFQYGFGVDSQGNSAPEMPAPVIFPRDAGNRDAYNSPMFSLIKKILGTKKRARAVDLSTADAQTRANLASGKGTTPEVLDYLAKDKEAGVRAAAVSNPVMQPQTALGMARDDSAHVRLALAQRLVTLLPGLGPEEHSQLYAYAVQAIRALAEDEVAKVRGALASALKTYAHAPPDVVKRLARDVERVVSEPILRFCVKLPDDDLLDILAGHPEPWVISAIAGREEVSGVVSAAVIDADDAPSGAVLVKNKGAILMPETLEKIVDRAREYPEWRAPAAMRRELPSNLALQLAAFVDEEVMVLLQSRDDFEPEMKAEITELVGRRLAYASQDDAPHERLRKCLAENRLNAETISDALSWHDRAFVELALATLARVPGETVVRMLKAGSARPIIALCWKARLPMRLAVDMQRHYARLLPKDVIYARGGTNYPLTPEEMVWQLEFFGIKAAAR